MRCLIAGRGTDEATTRYVKILHVTTIFLMLPGVLAAQAAAPRLAFETASVKPAAHNSIRNFVGGPGTRTTGQISYTNLTLEELLLAANGWTDPQKISGPAWLRVNRYDVTATLSPSATKEQFQEMLRNLLMERFKVVLHHESKTVPAYDLVVAPGGLSLKKSKEPAPESKAPSKPDGYPILSNLTGPGLAIWMGDGRGKLRAREEPPFVLARMLSGPAGRPIVDKTGVTARFDFTLDFDIRLTAGQTPKKAGPDEDPAPSLFDALEQKLGLKLVESKTALDVIVIDHAESAPSGG
jgi:uncharacterized protein (TIGR03435 family)